MPSEPQGDGVVSGYAARLETLSREHAELDARSGRLSAARGLTFLGAVGLAIYRFAGHGPAFVGWLVLALGLAFAVLVAVHGRLVAHTLRLEKRKLLVQDSIKRAKGDSVDFAEKGERFVEPNHGYAGDLDVLGRASLYQRLVTAQTARGQATLAAWLMAPADASEVAERQAAVKELATLDGLREELAFEGVVAGGARADVDPVLAWAEDRVELGPDASPTRRLLVAIARVCVPVTAALFATGRLVSEPSEWLRAAWLIPFFVQVSVWLSLRPTIDAVVARASSREAPFGRYRGMFAVLEAASFTSPRLLSLQRKLKHDGRSASAEMDRLGSLVGWAELRHGQIIGLLANLAFNYDLFVALALEAWRRRSGRDVRAWLDALGEIEALASLGSYAHDHPSYAFPEVQDGPARYEAECLGHPLLPAEKRVDNDVALGGDLSGFMVTGSNMSGKSTMLRSMGLGAVMALAGGPVCATSMRLSPLRVRTSMRISDSLDSGVSHFYAELLRLKATVSSVEQPGPTVLFLLDEVLHGTNSRERQIGAKAVIKHLIARGAIGAVSSHDLGLAALEAETEGRVRNVHFEELVEGGKMTFDYRLKPGVVRTSNALELMRLVGLAVPDDAAKDV